MSALGRSNLIEYLFHIEYSLPNYPPVQNIVSILTARDGTVLDSIYFISHLLPSFVAAS